MIVLGFANQVRVLHRNRQNGMDDRIKKMDYSMQQITAAVFNNQVLAS